MDKILNWFGTNIDKVCHFCICVVISIVFGGIIFRTTEGVTPIVCAGCGFMSSFIVGVLKEYCDRASGKGVFDLKDLLADVLGGLAGSIIFFLLFV